MAAGQPQAGSDDEQMLVSRAIKGDAAAFGKLYEMHLRAIYRYIFFRVGDVHTAEDLTEEVFVRAWEAVPSYKPRKHPFTSWLYRIAHNLVVDHQRKRWEEPLDETETSNNPSRTIPPEELVALRQDVVMLVGAVQQLEDEEQEVLILRFVEGLSHREVAAVIGKSEGASRVIQHRALSRLQELLADRTTLHD